MNKHPLEPAFAKIRRSEVHIKDLNAAINAYLETRPYRLLPQVTAAAATQFAYDGLAMIAEYDGAGTLLRRFVHGPGIDEPLVQYEGTGTTDRRWLHADERGSVVAVSDAAGNALTINRYDEYGKPQGTNAGRFGYTGQTWLGEVGLNYYKARMYAPQLGRFLQPDPIGVEGGVNLYAYVGNDPVNYTDPTGLVPCDIYVGGDCVEFTVTGSRSGTSDLDRFWGWLGAIGRGGPIERRYEPGGGTGGGNVTPPPPPSPVERDKGLLDDLKDAFCALPPIEISGGADAYLGIGASASLGISLDIRTLQLRGSVSSTLGGGYGGGLGVGLGTGATTSGFASEVTATIAGGSGSITLGQGGFGGGTGPKFGPQFGSGWAGVARKYTTPATRDLTGACK